LQIYEPKLANWKCTSPSKSAYVRSLTLFPDISHLEGLIPKEFGADAVEIPGSRALLDQLEENSVPWCIVTSGTMPLVTGWLDVMKLAHPKNLVVAESVKIGKPDPACYTLGRTKLELPHSDPSIIVFEDAPAGVRAGKAAGFTVVALNTTHSIQQLIECGPDWIVSQAQRSNESKVVKSVQNVTWVAPHSPCNKTDSYYMLPHPRRKAEFSSTYQRH
jgi:glycerol 3-phosphatase-1